MLILDRTRNLISDGNSLNAKDSNGNFINPSTYTTSWTATNSTISVNSTTYVYPLQYSLKVQPVNENSTIVLSLHGVIPETFDINGSSAQFHCQFMTTTESNISAKLTSVATSQFSAYAQNMVPGVWSPVFSPVIELEVVDLDLNVLEFDIDISITNHSGQVFYMSGPTLMNEFGFTENVFVSNMRKFIPTFIWDKDKIQEYPNYPFTKLFDVLTRAGDYSTVLYRRFYNYLNYQVSTKNRDEPFRYSQLIDPEYVDVDYQNWLSYFNGAKLYKTITSSNAAEVIDNVDESITWQLTEGYFGRNAGTLEAIKECAKQVLTGNKIVYVFPGGSFFQINVYTLLSETPGVVSAGDTSPQVEAILEKTKPMGFVLNHEAYADLPFILDSAIYGTLGTAALG